MIRNCNRSTEVHVFVCISQSQLFNVMHIPSQLHLYYKYTGTLTDKWNEMHGPKWKETTNQRQKSNSWIKEENNAATARIPFVVYGKRNASDCNEFAIWSSIVVTVTSFIRYDDQTYTSVFVWYAYLWTLFFIVCVCVFLCISRSGSVSELWNWNTKIWTHTELCVISFKQTHQSALSLSLAPVDVVSCVPSTQNGSGKEAMPNNVNGYIRWALIALEWQRKFSYRILFLAIGSERKFRSVIIVVDDIVRFEYSYFTSHRVEFEFLKSILSLWRSSQKHLGYTGLFQHTDKSMMVICGWI